MAAVALGKGRQKPSWTAAVRVVVPVSVHSKPWAQEPHPIDCSQCRDAARAYRASNNFKMACEAEEKSADANVRLDNYWHAGKALERATELLTKCEPLDGGAVLQMAERANDAYVMANRTQVGAESLSRAARLLETSDTKTSAALLMRIPLESLERLLERAS